MYIGTYGQLEACELLYQLGRKGNGREKMGVTKLKGGWSKGRKGERREERKELGMEGGRRGERGQGDREERKGS